MSENPFKELISDILNKDLLDLDDNLISSLAVKIDKKIMNIVRIIVSDKQLEKIDDFQGLHYFFVGMFMDSCKDSDNDFIVDLAFSITKGILAISVPAACHDLKNEEQFDLANEDYDKRIHRIKRKVASCFGILQSDRFAKD